MKYFNIVEGFKYIVTFSILYYVALCKALSGEKFIKEEVEVATKHALQGYVCHNRWFIPKRIKTNLG